MASLRIHVERAIGRIKTFHILAETIPNQIIFVCAFLTNFQPALVTPPKNLGEDEVNDYFKRLSSDSELSDSDVAFDIDSDDSD